MASKKTTLLLLAMGWVPFVIQAQLITHDPTSFMAQTRNMVQQGLRHAEQVQKLKQGIKLARQTHEQLEQMKRFEARIQDELRFLGDLKDLKITEIERILEGYFCLALPQHSATSWGTDYWGQLRNFLQRGYCREDAQRLKQFFETNRSAAPDYHTHARQSAEHLQKQYAQEELVQQRRYQLAMLYEQLSADLMGKAEELRHQLTRDGGNLKMSDGERAAALATIQELSLRAVELKAESVAALEQAQTPGPAQVFYQKTQQRRLQREAELDQMMNMLHLNNP